MAQTSEILSLAPFRTYCCDVLLTVNIEVEVLVLDLLVLAVFTQSRDSSVDLVFQGVALAYGDTHAITKVLDVGECRACECVAFASRGLPARPIQMVVTCRSWNIFNRSDRNPICPE